METLTIFTPTYNRAKFLPKAFEALKRQTLKDFLWMIIDDGSTDKSAMILDKYSQCNNIKIIHQQNMGISAARNIALKNICGNYLMFVDSDDILPDNTIETLMNLAEEKNEDIVVLSADSGKSSGFGEFIEKYPDRYFECGIMEQGVIGISSGLATTGKVPVFCAIAPFVTARPFEMFRNDLGYMNQNVKVVGRNCGITYSDLGATHHSLEDFAIVRMIPGVTILAPQDPYEIEEAVKAMLSMNGPVYMRIGNPKIPVLFEKEPFVIGKGRKITEGEALTLITTGSMTMAAMEAVERLEEEGIQVEHIGMPTVWPIDAELICDSVKKTGRVMTIEEHYIKGGLGTIVMETLNDNGINVPIKMHGIPHCYASNGPYNELMAYYKLDADGVYGGIKEFLKNEEGNK